MKIAGGMGSYVLLLFRRRGCVARDGVRKIRNDQSGQALVLTIVSMAALMGFMALALDVGQLLLDKRQLQTAADAAALAGAIELQHCGGSPNCGARQSAALSAVTENGWADPALIKQCASSSGDGITLTLNNGPCAS